MAWIESHQALSRHRKTLRMVGSLRMNRYELLGHLHELWWWGLDNADATGHLGPVAKEVLAEAAGIPLKDADRWVGALLDAGGGNGQPGYLDENETGYVLHDWYDYAGKFYEQREGRKETNRRAQAARRQRLRIAESAQSTSTQLALSQPDVSADEADRSEPVSDLPNLTGPRQPRQDDSPYPPSRNGQPKKADLAPGETVVNGMIYSPPNADGDRWPTGRKA